MKESTKRRGICILLAALVLGWMLLIFGFSAQSGTESGGLSALIAEPVTKLLVSKADEMDAEQEAALYLQVDDAVRTAAHFAEYTCLGVLLMLLSACLGWTKRWLPVSVGVLYALTDELHQAFSPGRSCEVQDVLVDSLGVFAGETLCRILIRIWRKKHVHHS